MARQVLVTGASRPAGAAVVRLLRAQGVVVVAADSRPVTGDPGALVLPPPDHPSFHWSLSRALEERRVGLLVPTVDEELPIVAEARSRLAEAGCQVFISPSEAIRAANDRWWTYETLRLKGIDVPRSVCGIPRPAAAGLLPFPVVSFPRLRGSDGQVAEHERLEDLPERLSAGRVYCERLPGARYEVHLFAAGGSEATALVTLRGGPKGLGIEVVEEPDVDALARTASRALLLEGPACLEVQRDRRHRPRVLGVEARPGDHVERAPAVVAALLRAFSD